MRMDSSTGFEPRVADDERPAEALPSAVIDSLSEVVVIWDADDRLVMCNRRLAERDAEAAAIHAPGTGFEACLRAELARGDYPEALGREEAWLAERLERHRNPGEAFEVARPEGRWLLVRERRLPDGGIATMAADITERKQIEERLELRERQLAESQRIGRIGHWQWNRAEDRFEASEVIHRIYGLTPDAPLTFVTVTDAIHEDDRAWAETNREAAVAERRGYDFAFRIRRPDGEVRHVEGRTNPRLDENDEIVGFFGVTQDVTERRWAEQALEQRTRTLELLQTVAAAANSASSAEESIQTCVDAVCAHTGWPVGHAYMRADDDALWPTGIWHLDDPDRFETFRAVTEESRFGSGIGLPGRVLASGQPAWISDVEADSNFPRAQAAANLGVRGAFGLPILSGREVAAVLEFFSDRIVEPDEALLEIMAQVGLQLGRVIERKRAEAALDEERARLEAILELAPDAVIVIDTDQRIRLYSQGAANIFGHGIDAALGQPLDMLLPHRSRAAHGGWVRGFAEGAEASRKMGERGEVHGLRKDGTEFPAEAAIAKIPLAGETLYTVVLRDISERKQAEEQLRQAQKMEAIGQLTGGIAHDFNNLLAIIQGNIGVLDRRLGAESEHKALTEPALRAAKRGASLTRRLLAFSRRQSLEVGAVDAGALIGDLEELLSRSLGEDVDLKIAVDPDLWTCRVDAGELEQAIINLANNARDAMAKGGKLGIEIGNATLTDDQAGRLAGATAGDYVRIAVTDTGHGMSPEVSARIFEPFFTTKEVGKGSGLGLAMVYGFVHQSGGHLTVRSEPGLGTTFRLYLPRLVAKPVEAASEAAEAYWAEGETVLVVEDDADLRKMIGMQLAELGYRVLEAETGNRAMALLRTSGAVDLLLTDVVLPGGMSGPQIAEQGRRALPLLKVVFMSGYDEAAVSEAADLEEAVAMLQKPFELAELGARLREVLEDR
jgi:PAS domain S-box-containing protein